jgi:hypothetical protein
MELLKGAFEPEICEDTGCAVSRADHIYHVEVVLLY